MAVPVENIIVEGMALNDFGFVAFDTLSGLGLNTFGFLWDATDIWTDCNLCNEDTVTVWVDPGNSSLPNVGTEPIQDIVIDGQELNTFGFISSYNTICGISLDTFGFLFLLSDQWDECAPCNEDIVTNWVTAGTIFLDTEQNQDIETEDGSALLAEQVINGSN